MRTATGGCYEAFMVENGDGAAAVDDELAVPQAAHCRADADPPHAQHERKKFLRYLTSGPLRRPIASCNLGEISSFKFARDLREPECQGCTPTVCTVQKVELCRARLIERLDRRNVVTIAETKKDSLERRLIELAALRDNYISQGKVQRRRISASVARTLRRAAHQATFNEQLVRDRIKS